MVVALLGACGDDSGWSAPDGGEDPADAHHEPGDIVDFFGEACVADPAPTNTVCHGGRGWCIDDVCRPMCIQDARRCPGAVEHHADSGACYCTQR